MTHNVLIIGSGPAGLTAAIYAGRAGLEPLLIEGREVGGQLTKTTLVENFPGFPKGIQGLELMRLMKEQAAKFGARFIREEVRRVDFKKQPFVFYTDSQELEAKTVIIATGSKPKRLGLASEEKFWGKGVSACAVCDGAFFKNKEVAVIGGGDAAIVQALFLAKLAQKVVIIHRRDQLRASKIMQERAKANSKINFLWNTVVEEVLGEQKVEGLKLKNLKTNGQMNLPCQGIFLAIGYQPETETFNGQLELDQNGYIKIETGTSKTNVPGIFACGDAADFKYRQAITAAASGCKAALDAEEYLCTIAPCDKE